MTVSQAKRVFHCFGCEAAGNAIQFIEQMNGESFPNAFSILEATVRESSPLGDIDTASNAVN